MSKSFTTGGRELKDIVLDVDLPNRVPVAYYTLWYYWPAFKMKNLTLSTEDHLTPVRSSRLLHSVVLLGTFKSTDDGRGGLETRVWTASTIYIYSKIRNTRTDGTFICIKACS